MESEPWRELSDYFWKEGKLVRDRGLRIQQCASTIMFYGLTGDNTLSTLSIEMPENANEYLVDLLITMLV